MKKYSILIVDGDENFLNESKEALSAGGYSVMTAETGRDAAITVRKHCPDIILLDKKLPDMDGQDLIKNLKKTSKDVSIIIITAYGDLNLAITGIHEGVVDYIVKPADSKDILARIETIIKNKEKSHKETDEFKKWSLLQNIKYRTLFETANDAIFVAETKSGELIDCNTAAVKLLGYKKEEIIGQNQAFLHPFDNKKKYAGMFKEHVEKGSVATESEVQAKDGTKIPVLISAGTVKIDGDKYIQGIFRDLRPLKERERELKEKEKTNLRLRKYDELKSEFVNNVAHELINPLSIIKESVKIVTDGMAGEVNGEAKKILEVSRKEIDRLLRFTKNMLDLSRIESGKMPVTMRKAKIRELIRDTAKQFEKEFNDKKINFTLDIEDAPDVITADNDLLKEVFINLLGNALKYTPAGRKIELRAFKKNGNFYLEVMDEGPGIPKDKQDKLFSKFYRVAKDRETGSGLGLSITKGIVKLHKGKIWVESEEGKGAKFLVEIPIK